MNLVFVGEGVVVNLDNVASINFGGGEGDKLVAVVRYAVSAPEGDIREDGLAYHKFVGIEAERLFDYLRSPGISVFAETRGGDGDS